MRWATFIFPVLVIALLAGCWEKPSATVVGQQDTISWHSLLSDAVDLNDLVNSSTYIGASRLFSSSGNSNKVTLAGYAPKISGDLDHGSYLEIQEVEDGVEAVLAEMEGSGAITWIWSANPVGDLILEIDGKRTKMAFQTFLQGGWLPVRYPFVSKIAVGCNLHFPILHQNRCRVLVVAKSRAELGSMFYQIAWNAIDSSRVIKPFDLEEFKSESIKLTQLARRIQRPKQAPETARYNVKLPAGDAATVLSVSGSGILQRLKFAAMSKKQLGALYIEVFFDQEKTPSIACPLHMLFSVSKRFEDVHSLPVTVSKQMATLYWPMPFSHGVTIRMVNRGDEEFNVAGLYSLNNKKQSNARLRGHYFNHVNLQTDEQYMLKLAEPVGKGTVVGCILHVQNRSAGWWGEGDPFIWIDSEDRPVWHGTGTEDYFGLAWCSTAKFQHPFRGQTRADSSATSLYRYHLLDRLPFNEWARFSFETCGSASGSMDYSALVLWYSDTSPTND